MLEPVTETGNSLSSDITPQTSSIEINGEDISWNKSNSMTIGQQRRNSTGNTPRLIRHTPSRATSPTPVTHHVTQSRASSPSRYMITRAPASAFHVPNQAPSPAHHVPHRGTSPARFVPSRSASPTRHLSSHASSTPIRHLAARGLSPAQFPTSRGNSPAGRVSRRRSTPTGRATGRVTTPRNHLITANVHTTPRRYRKLNGNVTPARRPAQNRARHAAAQKSVSYEGTLSAEGDGAGFMRTLDSIPAHSGSSSAYDFLESNRRNIVKPKPRSRNISVTDIDLDVTEEQEELEDQGDDKPWLPTGIYAVFLITLWTAVLRLVDSVEGNGPMACSEGEETRLWICAASFSLVQGLAEAFWQRKNLLKVVFSMCCLFGYFIISHIQPLSCRLGVDKVTEISKWQSAVNFFVSALLGIMIYRHILELMQERKITKEKRKQRRQCEEGDDHDEFEGLPEYIL